MSPRVLERQSAWLPTVFVLVIVLLAGARLIVLSLERHAEDARADAHAALTGRQLAVEAQFAALADRATREAARAARAEASGADSIKPANDTFYLRGDGSIVRAANVSPALATAIANEWNASPSAETPARFLGPLRVGSQWIVALRAPIGRGTSAADSSGESAANAANLASASAETAGEPVDTRSASDETAGRPVDTRSASDETAGRPVDTRGASEQTAVKLPDSPGSSEEAAGSGHPDTWAVTYADLDELLVAAKVGQLVAKGYQFSLSQLDPATARPRALVSSGPTNLEAPARVTLRPPAGFTPTLDGRLVLAIRPRDGWYPASRLASEVGLLALMAWLLAFGTHDLIHRAQRLSAQLADSQQRQRALGEQLMAEIEERQDLQKSFEHARYHDAFTGLPNRRFFMDQLDRALRAVRARRRQGAAVALIDIDRLKLINETLGHAAGDELMVQAAHRFEERASGYESVLARWEGGQLAILLLDVPTPEMALQITRTMLECLREPFELRRHRLAVAASAGVTCADSGLQRAEDLLREADIALSVARRTEGVKAIAYASSMGGDAASLVSLEADLHLALERNELRLLFQPIVDLRTRQTVGAEALLRWQHPVEGLLTPDRFLSIAEEAGLMVPITHWIIARVCKLAGEWRQRLEPGRPFYISVNLSAASLRDPQLSEFVAATLARTHAPFGSLKFEITEEGLIDNVGEARAMLRRLHDLGIELMLDDFGTGYSSLNHLELFPFDFVKIDRPFVSRLGTDSANSGIMAAVVQIASSLGLRAIAEVIETQPIAQALQRMGCEYGQGFYFSAPIEAEEVLQRMRGRSGPGSQTGSREGPEDDSPTLVLPMISR